MPIFRTFKAVFGVVVVLICIVNTPAQIRRTKPVDAPGVATREMISGDTRKLAETLVTSASESEFHGRVTDAAGRSVKAARIMLYCLETDQIYRASSNTFGYYQFKGLADGGTFLASISHARYIFLTGSLSFTLTGEPVEVDFQAGRIR